MKIKWELLPAAIAAINTLAPPFALAQHVGPLNTVQCSQVLVKAVGTATTAQLMTGDAAKIIYLCGWSMTNTGTAAGTFTLQYGQGTTCSTNTSSITSALAVTATAPATDHTTYAFFNVPTLTSATVNNLCINVTSGVGGNNYVGQY